MSYGHTGSERQEWLQDIREQVDEWVLCDDITEAGRNLPSDEAAVAWQAVHDLRAKAVRVAAAEALEIRLSESSEEIRKLQTEVRAGEIARRVLAGYGVSGEGSPLVNDAIERDYRNMPETQIRINLMSRRDAYSPNPGYLNLRNTIMDHTGCNLQVAGLAATKLVQFENLRPEFFNVSEVPEGGMLITFKGTGDQLPTPSDLFAYERNIGHKTLNTILDLFWSLGLEKALKQAQELATSTS
jgi:hypothetical protein